MSAPFELRNLEKSYGQVKAVADVSLEMKDGEVLGLLGPNGAGKTTLISILTTLETPTKGDAFIFGESVTKNSKATKPMIGVVPQELVSHGFFSIEEILGFHSGYYGIRHNKPQIDFLIDRLGLGPHRHKKVRQLSGGMKRRLLIAKALVHKPRLLLLDEPTAGVDIELRTSLWTFVRELNKQGTSVLLTTHYLEEAENLCARIAIIHKGKLVKVGETKSLVKQLTAREITLCMRAPVPRPQHAGLVDMKEAGDHVQLTFRVASQVTLSELATEAKLPMTQLIDVKIREGNLEDAFRHMVVEDGK